jgi:hypothetical protein
MVLDNGLRAEAHVEELIRDRMVRQAATLGRSSPVTLSAVVCEPVLHTGDPAIMKEQLEYLVDISHRPNVHVWVVPTRAGVHAGHSGPFVVATLGNGDRIGYIDDQLEGKIVSGAGKVTDLERVWESVVDLALPGRQSRDLILRVIDEYEQQAELA